MKKTAMSRVSKYASYRKQIGKMTDVEQDSSQTFFEPATIKEAKKVQINTTTSLDAETILMEIEKRQDPTGQEKKQREYDMKLSKITQIITIVVISLLALALLTVIFIYLYWRLS